MNTQEMDALIKYIKTNHLVIGTAESCTAGKIMSTIANHGNCGDCLCIGYVVYSRNAKKKQLGVKDSTIEAFTLTSEEVAREMAQGVFQIEEINITIATTGIIGDKSMDDIPPGTVCTAWGFKKGKHIEFFSDTKLLKGSREEMCLKAVHHALAQVPVHHQNFLNKLKNS